MGRGIEFESRIKRPNVTEINQKRLFTLDDAKVLLPLIIRITQNAFSEVKKSTTQLSYTKEKSTKVAAEAKIQFVFTQWRQKIQKLGGEAKGMWLVDFDSGDGYYCWHYPETNIAYFHGYFDGFKGRVKIH
jgi:hypothetical protein